MSARIYYLRRPYRRRRRVLVPVSRRRVIRRYSRPAYGFFLLMYLTIPAAFLYLSGAAYMARHDGLYAVLLAAVWSVYFTSDTLRRTRLGLLLVRAGMLLVLAGVAGFFGFVYWLILRHR